MALTMTVTKKSVDRLDGNVYNITANLKCMDGATEVINQDFSTTYNGDAAPALANLLNQMQMEIDSYKAEYTIFMSQTMSNAMAYIQNKLVG